MRTTSLGAVALIIAAAAPTTAPTTAPAAATASPAQPPDVASATGAEGPAVVSTNAFGIDLYRALRAEDPARNLFISPLSLAMALTMTAEGAADQTEAEMAKVLHFPPVASPSQRAIAAVHGGHAALAEGLRAAAGTADPKIRGRVDALRARLAELEAQARTLGAGERWKEASEVARQARAVTEELNALLTSIDRFELRIANALWVERSFDVVPAFIQAIDRFYGGGVTELDIRGQSEQARAQINDWVAEQTAQRIKDLIPEGGLKPDTRLVITNAVYFKGEWAVPFEEAATRDEPFTLGDGSKVRSTLMHDSHRDAIGYAAFTGAGDYFATPREVPRDEARRPATYPDDAGFSMIELPYKGGTLTMVVIAPRSPDGLAGIESRLGAEALEDWLERLERRTVDVALPRFKLEWEQELSRTLQAMGMRRAFVDPARGDGAQFPGMSASADPSQRLYIGAVRHKSWVEVTEKGTEAAAATSVEMAPTSVAPEPEMIPFIPQFRADRPFIFLIRDTTSGAILFVGSVVDPAA